VNISKDFTCQLLATAGQTFFGGLYIVVLYKLVSAEDFGVYSLLTSITAIGFQILDYRPQEAVPRLMGVIDNSNQRKLIEVWVQLNILDLLTKTVCAFSLIVFFAASKYCLDKKPTNTESVAVVLIVVASTYVSKLGNGVAQAALRVTQNYHAIAIIVTVEHGAKLGYLAISYALGHESLNNILSGSLAISAIVCIAANIIGWKNWKQKYAPNLPLREFPPKNINRFLFNSRDNWKYVLGNVAFSIIDLPAKELDVIICSAYLKIQDVGTYKLCKLAAGLLWKPFEPVLLILVPRLTLLIQTHDHKQIRDLVSKVSKTAFLVASVLYILELLLSSYGSAVYDKLGLQTAIHQLPYMTFWIVIAAPLVWTHSLLASFGLSWSILIASIISNAVALWCINDLTASWGLKGAGVAWSLGLCGYYVVAFFILLKNPKTKGIFNQCI